MKQFFKILFCILFIFFINQKLYAQYYIKKRIDFGPQSVFCIYQDHKGFMWFGTNEGLIKYDGAKYKKYKYQINDSSSISSNNINHIVEDKYKNLWISTQNNGLNKYIASKDNFIRFQKTFKFQSRTESNVIRILYSDNKGNIWFGSLFGGLNKYNPEKEIFERIDKPADSIQTVSAICEDKNGNILLSTDKHGITPFDPTERTVLKKTYSALINELKPYYIEKIKRVSKNKIWFFASRKGIIEYNEDLKSFRYIDYGKANSETICNAFCKNNMKEACIGTNKGLKSVCENTGKITNFQILPYKYKPDAEVHAIFKDKSNCLWISTFSEGLYQYIPIKAFNHYYSQYHTFPFKGSFVLDVKEDIDQNVWVIISNKGIYIFNPKTFKTVQVKFPKNLSSLRTSALPKDAKRLYEDKNHNVGIKEVMDKSANTFQL